MARHAEHVNLNERLAELPFKQPISTSVGSAYLRQARPTDQSEVLLRIIIVERLRLLKNNRIQI